MREAVDLLMGASKGLSYTGIAQSSPGVETSGSERAEVALAGACRGETVRAPHWQEPASAHAFSGLSSSFPAHVPEAKPAREPGTVIVAGRLPSPPGEAVSWPQSSDL